MAHTSFKHALTKPVNIEILTPYSKMTVILIFFSLNANDLAVPLTEAKGRRRVKLNVEKRIQIMTISV